MWFKISETRRVRFWGEDEVMFEVFDKIKMDDFGDAVDWVAVPGSACMMSRDDRRIAVAVLNRIGFSTIDGSFATGGDLRKGFP